MRVHSVDKAAIFMNENRDYLDFSRHVAYCVTNNPKEENSGKSVVCSQFFLSSDINSIRFVTKVVYCGVSSSHSNAGSHTHLEKPWSETV